MYTYLNGYSSTGWYATADDDDIIWCERSNEFADVPIIQIKISTEQHFLPLLALVTRAFHTIDRNGSCDKVN